jgi:hypothetical protein
MAFSSKKRGVLLLVAAFLLAAATFAPPTPGHAPLGAQSLTTCPSLRCPNGQILTCTVAPCRSLDNCGIICAGHVDRCTGACIIE